jgi:hypothetical protein
MRCQARGLPGGVDFLPFWMGRLMAVTCHRNYFWCKRNQKNRLAVDYVQNATALSKQSQRARSIRASREAFQASDGNYSAAIFASGFLKIDALGWL